MGLKGPSLANLEKIENGFVGSKELKKDSNLTIFLFFFGGGEGFSLCFDAFVVCRAFV